MPANWWKATRNVDDEDGDEGQPAAFIAGGVVTVIRVAATTAPFHTTGTSVDSAPMARGAASTVALTVPALVERLVADAVSRDEVKRPRDE